MTTLIIHRLENAEISQRLDDGYINATALCQASGKLFADYLRLARTQEFLATLSVDMGIPISTLVDVTKGGNRHEQGTWIHPDIAVNLGQWCSAKFAVAVSRWVREWMTGKPAFTEAPKDPMAVIEALNVALEQAKAAETYRQATQALAQHTVVQKAEIKAKEAVIELQAKDVELLHDLMRDPAETMSLAEAAPIIIPEWCQGAGGQNQLADLLLQGICFLREALERAIGSDRRTGNEGLFCQNLLSDRKRPPPFQQSPQGHSASAFR